MGIVDKIENFVNETKEMSLKKVMDKIEDGYWEAEEDVKVGKHVTIRDTKTKKRMTILVTEDLDEATGLKFTKKDKSSWEKQAKTMGLVIKPATDSEGESDKMWNAKDKQGNTKGEFHLDKGGFLKEDFDDSELEELDSISEATFAQHMKKAVEAKERGDEKKTLYHLGNAKTARYAMKSTEISKNKELLDKYKEMTKNLSESELDEAAKMPLTLKIGDSFKTDEGSIKITDITVSSLHMNPITYITYKYDVVIDGKPLKGEEKAALNSFKDHFKK